MMSSSSFRTSKCSNRIIRYHYAILSINVFLTLVLLRFNRTTSSYNKLCVNAFISPGRVFASHTRNSLSPFSSHYNSFTGQNVNVNFRVTRMLERAELEQDENCKMTGNSELSLLTVKANDPKAICNEHTASIEAKSATQFEIGTQIFPRQVVMSVAGLVAVSVLFFLGFHQQGHSTPVDFDFRSFVDSTVLTVEKMGPNGVLYFAAFYVLAEVLALPSMPLTASAGYLFGWQVGTLVVLISATIAAAISFAIARTFLREYVEDLLELNPKFKIIDRVIGKVKK